MSTLIIYAHPRKDTHCGRVLSQVEKRLNSEKELYSIIDLYKEKFDPVLKEEELYTAGNHKVSVQNKRYQKMIKDNDLLIFIYPMWWGTMPAILKGFIERVFTPRFAFVYENGRPRGLLKGKEAIAFMTSGGPSWMYKILGNAPAKMFKLHIMRFCGVKSKMYNIGNCQDISEDKKKIDKTVKKALSNICE